MDIDLGSNTSLAFTLSIKNSPGMTLTDITVKSTKLSVQLNEQLIIMGVPAATNSKLNVKMLYCYPQ